MYSLSPSQFRRSEPGPIRRAAETAPRIGPTRPICQFHLNRVPPSTSSKAACRQPAGTASAPCCEPLRPGMSQNLEGQRALGTHALGLGDEACPLPTGPRSRSRHGRKMRAMAIAPGALPPATTVDLQAAGVAGSLVRTGRAATLPSGAIGVRPARERSWPKIASESTEDTQEARDLRRWGALGRTRTCNLLIRSSRPSG
jgi:hypothetical protein